MSPLKPLENTPEILRSLFLCCCSLGHQNQPHQGWRLPLGEVPNTPCSSAWHSHPLGLLLLLLPSGQEPAQKLPTSCAVMGLPRSKQRRDIRRWAPDAHPSSQGAHGTPSVFCSIAFPSPVIRLLDSPKLPYQRAWRTWFTANAEINQLNLLQVVSPQWGQKAKRQRA